MIGTPVTSPNVLRVEAGLRMNGLDREDVTGIYQRLETRGRLRAVGLPSDFQRSVELRVDDDYSVHGG